MKISQKDQQIISRLRLNARESLTTMSKKTGIPISTLFDKIRSQEYIKKFTALLDYSKLGYDTHALITIKANREKKEELKRHLLLHPHINSLYKVNSGYDFLIECLFSNLKKLDEFLENMQEKFCVEQMTVQYLIDELKKEEIMIIKQ